MNPLCARFQSEGISNFTSTMLVLSPFFKCIRPMVTALSVSGAEVAMATPSDHDTEVNVTGDAALCSLALFTGALAIDACMPPSGRWSLTGFKLDNIALIQYGVHAFADTSAIDWTMPGRYQVEVRLLANRREQIATGTMTIDITNA